MKGICRYIELMGSAIPEYIKDSWKNYLQGAPEKNKPN